MSDDKNKSKSSSNSNNQSKRDSDSGYVKKENWIGESQKDIDIIRKGAEVSPRPKKPSGK